MAWQAWSGYSCSSVAGSTAGLRHSSVILAAVAWEVHLDKMVQTLEGVVPVKGPMKNLGEGV